MSDQAWFSELYDKWFDQLYRYLYVRLRGKGRLDLQSEINDCIQETFMTLWDKRRVIFEHPNIEAWLIKTASNIMDNKLSADNTRKKHTAFSLDETFSSGSESVINRIDLVENSVQEETTADLLARVKDTVGEDMFALLVRYYDKEQPLESISAKYELTSSGIKMRVKRALEKIRKTINLFL